MALPSGAQLGPYQVTALIGQGGMGEVYRARDSRLGRHVAIKVLPASLLDDPQARTRFELEIRALAELAHPNILVLYDVGQENEVHYGVTEILEGETLRDRLSRGPIPWRKAVEIGAAVAEGLAAAHSKDIIHRDIKPANIFLTNDGRVKILDFGLALRQPKTKDGDATVTIAGDEPGTVMGTVGYMSPEQVRAEKAGAASDIFSLGIVLYEMVTGQRAFRGNSAPETMSAILNDDPPSVVDSGQHAPLDLGRIIERCLSKNPAQRFHSAHDLAFALRSITTGSRATVAPAGQPTRGRRLAWIAAAVLAPLIAAGAFYWRAKSSAQTIDSMAVLPFVNTSASPDTAYLSDGITESLIGSLSQIPKLKVMSRSAVFRYQGKATDPRTAGRELGVRAVLTGRITQHGDNLAVSAELINVDDNTELWGEQYNNRNINDALAVQKDIAERIVSMLKVRLSGEQATRMTKHQTSNPEAYQLYLKGRYYAAKFDPENLARGRDYLRQAIAADPGYALAYDGLSYYYALVTDWFEPASDVGPKALEAARKALELDPGLVEAHVELASAHMFYDFNWPLVESEYRRALELNPNYAAAHEFYAWYLIETGRRDEGLAEVLKAQALDPLSNEIAFEAGWLNFFARRYNEAMTQIIKAVELDPSVWVSYYVQGQIFEQLGRYPEALVA